MACKRLTDLPSGTERWQAGRGLLASHSGPQSGTSSKLPFLFWFFACLGSLLLSVNQAKTYVFFAGVLIPA